MIVDKLVMRIMSLATADFEPTRGQQLLQLNHRESGVVNLLQASSMGHDYYIYIFMYMCVTLNIFTLKNESNP
jgi:hypothetical protein